MRIVYQGVDTLDFAVKGALPADVLSRLREEKLSAAQSRAPVTTTIGPGSVTFQLSETGRSGGYAFTGHTGPLGAIYAFKDNPDPNQWNVFVSVRASALAVHGYVQARKAILAELAAMGCSTQEISVARIDYAVDVATSALVLDPERFVAHPHARLKPQYSEAGDSFQPTPVFRGRRVESVTIGKMPGRQMIVYDKRYAALKKRELFWFEIWKLPANDKSTQVWRVEARAGKRELKDRWQITTFEALDVALGDIVRESFAVIRYHAPEQTDSNISRQQLDPLWVTVTDAAWRSLVDFSSGLVPSRLLELERKKAVAIYEAQALGNLGGWASAAGLTDADLEYELPGLTAKLVSENLSRRFSSVRKSALKARERLRFIGKDVD